MAATEVDTLEELARNHWGKYVARARRKIGNGFDAEDIVQESFVVLMRIKPVVADPSYPSLNHLFEKVLRFRIRTHLEKRSRWSKIVTPDGITSEPQSDQRSQIYAQVLVGELLADSLTAAQEHAVESMMMGPDGRGHYKDGIPYSYYRSARDLLKNRMDQRLINDESKAHRRLIKTAPKGAAAGGVSRRLSHGV